MPARRRRPETPKIQEVKIGTQAIDVALTYGPNDYKQTVTIPVENPEPSGAVTPELVANAVEVVALLLEEPESAPDTPSPLAD